MQNTVPLLCVREVIAILHVCSGMGVYGLFMTDLSAKNIKFLCLELIISVPQLSCLVYNITVIL